MKNKGFTLMELIITIAILGTISMIAVPSLTGIQHRVQVNADKQTGAQIGTAFVIKDLDIGLSKEVSENGMIKYDSENTISAYISPEYKPESLENGFYVISRTEINAEKVLMVGITKNENGETLPIPPAIYDGIGPGWVWSSGGPLEKNLPTEEIKAEKIEIIRWSIEIIANSNIFSVAPPTSNYIYDSGKFLIENEDDITFEIAVIDNNYEIADVIVDEDSKGTCENWTFSNVKGDHILEVIAKAKTNEEYGENEGVLLASKVKVGDYIEYTPSRTSYTVVSSESGYDEDQSYIPSDITMWMVLSNDGTNVEIVSPYSVGALYLKGDTGYINAVQTLNDMASAYVNDTYAESGRSLGYSDKKRYISPTDSGSAMTETELANYKTIDTSLYPLSYGVSSDYQFPYVDYQFDLDRDTLDSHNLMQRIIGSVWLASRSSVTDSDHSYFYVRRLSDEGYDYKALLFSSTKSGHDFNSEIAYGVCPVVTLKSNVIITGGSGTSGYPYKISVK